jgi:hypothetical protein
MVLSSPPNIMPSELASERTDGEHGDERNQLQRAPHNLAKVTVRRGKCTPFLAKAYGRPIRVGYGGLEPKAAGVPCISLRCTDLPTVLSCPTTQASRRF